MLNIKGGEAPRLRAGAPGLLRQALKLTEADIWRNLAVLVGIPYLKRKLDQGFEVHGPIQNTVIQVGPVYRRDELPPNPTVRQHLFWYYKWFLRKVYPTINVAYSFAVLAFNLAYLFDNSKYSSPFLWLIGIRMRRLNEAEYRAFATTGSSSTAPRPQQGGKRKSPWKALFNPAVLGSALSSRLLSSLKLLLPASIFALKFLEWWHASDFGSQLSKKTVEGLDLTPPTLPHSFSGRSDQVNSSNGIRDQGSELAAATPKRSANSVALSDTFSPPPLSGTELSTASAQPTSLDPHDAQTRSTRPSPPISALSNLPIHTVSVPDRGMSNLCPICRHPIQTPTSAQTGYVFCYTCIFKWVDGSHDRQVAFMEGRNIGADWGDDGAHYRNDLARQGQEKSREGVWENGKGRCAVTGLRVLGGTAGLRRLMV